MSENENEELIKSLKALELKMAALSGPYEDALANRVFQKSQEQFKKWIGLWVAVATIGIGFIGIKGYYEVVDAGTRKASEFISQKAQSRLDEKLTAEVTRAVNEAKERLATQADRDLASALSTLKTAESPRQNLRAYAVAAYLTKAEGNKQKEPSPGDILSPITAVNLRESPSVSAAIVGVIGEDRRVKLLSVVGVGDDLRWYQVELLR